MADSESQPTGIRQPFSCRIPNHNKEVGMRTFYSLAFAVVLAMLPLVSGCSAGDEQSENVVVVYSSLDEEFAKPLAEQFEQETGLEVKLLSDTEKAKSSGLLNRLLEEKDRN